MHLQLISSSARLVLDPPRLAARTLYSSWSSPNTLCTTRVYVSPLLVMSYLLLSSNIRVPLYLEIVSKVRFGECLVI